MQAYGLEPQVALTTPLLLGTDGEKMSASRGNYIGLLEPPEEQFGKTMRISDAALPDYYRLVMESDEDPLAGEPMQAKLRLARFVVTRAHGEEAARRAEEHFTRVVRERQAPPEDAIDRVTLPDDDPVHVPALLASAFGMSTSEGRRLIAERAVRVNGEPVDALDVPRASLEGALVQAGRRRYARLTAA